MTRVLVDEDIVDAAIELFAGMASVYRVQGRHELATKAKRFGDELHEKSAFGLPEIVCLCGSTKFKEEYRAENQRLTMDGKIVISVGFFGHADDIQFTEREKEMLDELHKRKIDIADRIHVIDVDEYIGDSTWSEIKYADAHGKDVTYYSEVQ